jgi:16S rRNA (guanine966-N2)-methyltransferase
MSLLIISGLFKGRKIKTLSSLSTRPSSSKCRAGVFNICQLKIENSCFLDLYAGSGAMGIEALSRGASFSIFLENNRQAIRCIEDNISLLNIRDKTEIICLDVLLGLKKVKRRADIVYIDPPYKFYEKEDFIENILGQLLFYSLLNDDCLIFFETPSLLKFNLNQSKFPQISLLSERRYGSSALIEMSYQS